jgi:hypothetical protein
MWDYCTAQFDACTDFRVGEAIRYLREKKGCRISLRYKASGNPRKDEYDLIRELHVSGPRLLNGLVAYDYRTTDPAAERLFIPSILRFSSLNFFKLAHQRNRHA